jgi:hypothetical protein
MRLTASDWTPWTTQPEGVVGGGGDAAAAAATAGSLAVQYLAKPLYRGLDTKKTPLQVRDSH